MFTVLFGCSELIRMELGNFLIINFSCMTHMQVVVNMWNYLRISSALFLLFLIE